MKSKKLDKEYAPISGIAEFCKHSIQLAIDNEEIISNRLASTDVFNLLNFFIFRK